MITYKPYTYKVGEFYGEIGHVELVPNQFHKEEDANSCENVLNIALRILDTSDGEAVGEVVNIKFVRPLLGKGIFQQMIDAKGAAFDDGGGEIDEQQFVEMPVKVTLSVNPKGYPVLDNLEKSDKKVDWMTLKLSDISDLPWETDSK